MRFFKSKRDQIESFEKTLSKLKDKNWKVREEATITLGKINDARAVEPLIQALKDYDSSVRGSAAVALGKIGDARAVNPLIQAWLEDYGDAKKQESEGLANIGEPAVKPLIELLSNENGTLLGLAREILIKIGEPAVKPLTELLSNENETLRLSAQGILTTIEKLKLKEAKLASIKASYARIDSFLEYAFEKRTGNFDDEIRFKSSSGSIPLGNQFSTEKLNAILKRSKVSLNIALLALDASTEIEKEAGEAIERLCKINSPVTSNILNLVVRYPNLGRSGKVDYLDDHDEHLGISRSQFSSGYYDAKAELARRGNPPYNPAAYY